MEMLIQFGYVVLFSGAFPLAGLLCFANNILELRTDAFKICFSLQRPFARKAKSIGVWQVRLFKNLDTDLYMYGGGGGGWGCTCWTLLSSTCTAIGVLSFSIARLCPSLADWFSAQGTGDTCTALKFEHLLCM